MSEQTAEPKDTGNDDLEPLRKNWRWMVALGILWIVFGILAIVVPFAATLAFELLLGALFVVGGIAQIIQAFSCRGWRGFAFHVLTGLLAVVLGGLLLMFPIEGIATLTLVLSAFFLAEGILLIIAAFRYRPGEHWGWILFNGILALVIGGLILFGWPASAVWAIGLLVGIQFFFSGMMMTTMALAARKM